MRCNLRPEVSSPHCRGCPYKNLRRRQWRLVCSQSSMLSIAGSKLLALQLAWSLPVRLLQALSGLFWPCLALLGLAGPCLRCTSSLAHAYTAKNAQWHHAEAARLSLELQPASKSDTQAVQAGLSVTSAVSRASAHSLCRQPASCRDCCQQRCVRGVVEAFGLRPTADVQPAICTVSERTSAQAPAIPGPIEGKSGITVLVLLMRWAACGGRQLRL